MLTSNQPFKQKTLELTTGEFKARSSRAGGAFFSPFLVFYFHA